MSGEPNRWIIEIPTARLKDGRYFISDLDCDARVEIRAFVKRFPDYWSRHEFLDGWASPLGETPEGPYYTRADPMAEALRDYEPKSGRRSVYWDPKEQK